MNYYTLKEFVDNIPVTENSSFAVNEMKRRYSVPGGTAVKAYRKMLKTSKNEQAIHAKRKKAADIVKSNPEAALKLYGEIDKHFDALKQELKSLPDADEQDKRWVRARGLNIGLGKGAVRSAAEFETNNRQRAFRSLAKRVK